MFCPKCSNPRQGNFCANCGYNFVDNLQTVNNNQQPPNINSSPTAQIPNTMNNQLQNYQYRSGNQQYYGQQPEWYKDGSIIGLILTILSPYFVWDVSIVIGLAFVIIGLILGIMSKKYNGRISMLTIILSAIILTVEFLVLAGLFMLAQLLT